MRRCNLTALLLLLLATTAAAAPKVVVTIAPVHSLVAAVMQGVAKPRLLLPAGASPHGYALLPSDARALSQADLIVWTDDTLEAFLQKSLRTLAVHAATLEASSIAGLTLLDASADEHRHDHGAAATPARHPHETHLWLDPLNAARIVDAVQERLSEIDPEHATAYRENARRRKAQLLALDKEIAAAVAPVRDVPFLVFHDAYRYFEHRYGLHSAGALTLNPERPPGARTVAEARDRIDTLEIRCVFREPQFEPSLAEAIIRGTDARIGVLDPIGADVPPGPDAYILLMRNLTRSLVDCLRS
jgi:zinc transport system substrate-binding protein